MRERVVVLPCRHRRRWPWVVACGLTGALGASAVHVEREAARARDASQLLHGGTARVPVHPASKADLLAIRIDVQLALILALAERRRDVERLADEFGVLRGLLHRAAEHRELASRVSEWNLKLADLGCGGDRGIKLQSFVNTGNQALRQLAEALRRRDLAGAEVAHAWVEEIAAEMQGGEREVYHRNADALARRGRQLLAETRRLCAEGSRIEQLESELVRAREAAEVGARFIAATRWMAWRKDVPEWQRESSSRALVELHQRLQALDWSALRPEQISWIGAFERLSPERRGTVALRLWQDEGERVVRSLKQARDERDVRVVSLRLEAVLEGMRALESDAGQKAARDLLIEVNQASRTR